MRTLVTLSFLAASLMLAGCSSTNLAEVIKAASGDQATFCGTITTVYGTVKFARSNLFSGGEVSCNDLTMKSAPTNFNVPMTVTPTFEIKQKP